MIFAASSMKRNVTEWSERVYLGCYHQIIANERAFIIEHEGWANQEPRYLSFSTLLIPIASIGDSLKLLMSSSVQLYQ